MIRVVIYATLLRPLIRRNYRLREAGRWPDEWYWADELAMRWGFWTSDSDSGRWAEL